MKVLNEYMFLKEAFSEQFLKEAVFMLHVFCSDAIEEPFLVPSVLKRTIMKSEEHFNDLNILFYSKEPMEKFHGCS